MSTTPLIVACVRVADLRRQVDPLTGAVASDPLGMGMSAADEAAVEYALRLADLWSGRVVVVAAGPPIIEPVLRDVAALGADILRVPLGDDAVGLPFTTEIVGDEVDLARALIGAMMPLGRPDLVLCGDRSSDRGTGALPAFLAHQLGASQALGLVDLQPMTAPMSGAADASGPSSPTGPRRLVGERRLDRGWRERLEITLPAVCSVEGSGLSLRRGSLAAALQSSERPVPVNRPTTDAAARAEEVAGLDGMTRVHAGATRPYRPRPRVRPAPDGDDARLRLLELTGALDAHDPPTVMEPDTVAEAADVLLDFLGRHGYLAPSAADGRRP